MVYEMGASERDGGLSSTLIPFHRQWTIKARLHSLGALDFYLLPLFVADGKCDSAAAESESETLLSSPPSPVRRICGTFHCATRSPL